MNHMNDTIFALSTVLGKSGIAVIRISGPLSSKIPLMLGCDKIIKPRTAIFTSLYSLDATVLLDEVILLFFAAPHSFNGEDILEIHLHGGIAIINSMMNELSKISSMRIAEAGEFTKIAFYNGKMDLVKAEALSELLEAETEIQKLIAQNNLNGQLSSIYNKWRNDLISISSIIEALIDFPEDDIPHSVLNTVQQNINELEHDINIILLSYDNAYAIMNGINVVISGSPNVGKSSLMNVIAKKDIAIVSEFAGTTRDIIQVKLDIGGFAVLLHDTAGLRESDNQIEREGIKRAKKAISEAHINVIVLDIKEKCCSDVKSIPINLIDTIVSEQHLTGYKMENSIILLNKFDLLDDEMQQQIYSTLQTYDDSIIIPISTKSNSGIEEFLKSLKETVQNMYQEIMLTPIITKIRQKQILENCLQHLKQSRLQYKIEMSAQEIRIASEYIGMLTGKIYIEEILDKVFSNFCIGK